MRVTEGLHIGACAYMRVSSYNEAKFTGILMSQYGSDIDSDIICNPMMGLLIYSEVQSITISEKQLCMLMHQQLVIL